MPFNHVASSYQPEQLVKLAKAFDLVWPEVMQAKGAATDIQLDRLRKRLANACACLGEFEPEKLAQTALRAFTTRRAA